LEILVDGALLANNATGARKKFLRRIPVDPLTGSTDWGKRAYMDAPDSKWQYYWELHVMAAVRLARGLVPMMRQRY